MMCLLIIHTIPFGTKIRDFNAIYQVFESLLIEFYLRIKIKLHKSTANVVNRESVHGRTSAYLFLRALAWSLATAVEQGSAS